MCYQQGCCVRDHKPTLSSPQSTATENRTSADEPAGDKTDKDITTENNEEHEEHEQENTGEKSNNVLLAVTLYQNSNRETSKCVSKKWLPDL